MTSEVALVPTVKVNGNEEPIMDELTDDTPISALRDDVMKAESHVSLGVAVNDRVPQL